MAAQFVRKGDLQTVVDIADGNFEQRLESGIGRVIVLGFARACRPLEFV
jgi:hypothetical protein